MVIRPEGKEHNRRLIMTRASKSPTNAIGRMAIGHAQREVEKWLNRLLELEPINLKGRKDSRPAY